MHWLVTVCAIFTTTMLICDLSNPDVNECIEQSGVCVSPAQCINTLGSFKCMCPRGFQLDQTGTQCQDNDECMDDSRCENGCQVTKLMNNVSVWTSPPILVYQQNTMGSYRCACPDGYVQHPYYSQCIDDNECQQMSPCGNANCHNTLGSYRCACPDGYQFDGQLLVCVQVKL